MCIVMDVCHRKIYICVHINVYHTILYTYELSCFSFFYEDLNFHLVPFTFIYKNYLNTSCREVLLHMDFLSFLDSTA